MYPKSRRVRAAQHRGRKKQYSIALKKDVHEAIQTVARVLGESPGAVIARLLKR